MIKTNMIMIIVSVLMMLSCNDKSETLTLDTPEKDLIEYEKLPIREGVRPATTDEIPHKQLDLDIVPGVNTEMNRRVYSIPGIEKQPSVVLSWQGLSIDSNIEIVNPDALIGARELGHIHDDGSLHIFLEPSRAIEAIEAGWAISHPFAKQGRVGWKGFVMLYTPQNIDELNVVFQLIVDSFNYVSGQQLNATDFY